MNIKQLDERARINNRAILVHSGKLVGFINEEYYVGKKVIYQALGDIMEEEHKSCDDCGIPIKIRLCNSCYDSAIKQAKKEVFDDIENKMYKENENIDYFVVEELKKKHKVV